MDFFAAHKVEGYGRADGKEGNIFMKMQKLNNYLTPPYLYER